MCKSCAREPIIELFKKKFCAGCFIKYFERKTLNTIRKHELVKKGEKIGVAASSGKDSTTALYLLNKFGKKKRFDAIAIAIDEGIKGYRDLKPLEGFCKREGIKLVIYSFRKEFGVTLDQMIVKLKGKNKPCSICGVLRRYVLNKKAVELGISKLATGHNLDDEAQSILMNQFRRNVAASARLGPMTGVIPHKGFVRRIKPLYFLAEKEVTTYAFLKNLLNEYKECPYAEESYRNKLRDFLNEFDAIYPGTKHSIIESFLEILPCLKEKYIKEVEEGKARIKSCKRCKEPCSQDICQACKIFGMVKL